MAGGLAVAGHEGGKEALRWATGKTIVRPQEATWQGAEEKEKGQTGTMDAGRGERRGSERRGRQLQGQEWKSRSRAFGWCAWHS